MSASVPGSGTEVKLITSNPDPASTKETLVIGVSETKPTKPVSNHVFNGALRRKASPVLRLAVIPIPASVW
jgi:hypothetical protein